MTGDKYLACKLIGGCIIIISWTRDLLFFYTGYVTGNYEYLPETSRVLGIMILICGMTLVLSSHHKLGFYGTYMGDHCDIYLDKRITSFPFNMLDNPMYVGSSMNMLGYALFMKSPICMFISMIAFVNYYCWVNFHEE